MFFVCVLQTGAIRRPAVIVSAWAGRGTHISCLRYIFDAVSSLDGAAGIGRYDCG